MMIGEGEIASRNGEEIGEQLIRLRQKIDQDELEFSRLSAQFSRTNEHLRFGYATSIDWIRLNCHMTGPAAADRVKVGEQLAKLPESVQAMHAGDIGFTHIAFMSRTADALSRSETAGGFDESLLLEQARENSAGKFFHICRHARHAADPQGCAAEEVEHIENRSFKITPWGDGSFLLSGVLDPVGGAALRTALEPLARRAGKDDRRGRERRMGDAIVDLSMHALDNGLVPQRASQRTHLQVTSSLETLLGLTGAPAAEMEFSLPISAKAVERLACDCSVTRIVLGSDSMVIDVGRAKRVISGAQRKALNARDHGCVWPGCDRPASWTSGHHLVHWSRGGPGDLSNLCLLCYRHHWMVHEGDWQIVRTDDGFLTIPPTVTFGPRPRGPD
jgi:uncharacterized protein DUF222/HNH endonuclease